MKCPACSAECSRITAETEKGIAEFFVCPSGSHYFVKLPVKEVAAK